MEKKIVIMGTPITWKRPGGYEHRYDEQKHAKFSIGIDVKSQFCQAPPFKTAVQVNFAFYFMVPKAGGSRIKEELRGKPMLKRRDLDNLLKFYLDALSGIAWSDDALISIIIAKKIYGDPERTEITITEIE